MLALALVLIAGTPDYVAVLPAAADPKLVEEATAERLRSALEADLTESGAFAAVAGPKIRAAIDKNKRDSLSSRYDEKSQIAIGREVAAKHVVTTEIERHDKECEIRLKLYDLERAATRRAASAFDECSATGLRRAARAVAYRLAGIAPPKKKIAIRFDVDALPTIEAWNPGTKSASLDFATIDVAALETYDRAVKADRDQSGSMTTKQKIAAWEDVAKMMPKLRTTALERAQEWRAVLKFETRREADWNKLMRLFELEVISEQDKQDWAVAFLEVYGGRGLNPHFMDPRFNARIGEAAWTNEAKAILSEPTMETRLAAVKRFLETYPSCRSALTVSNDLSNRIALRDRARTKAAWLAGIYDLRGIPHCGKTYSAFNTRRFRFESVSAEGCRFEVQNCRQGYESCFRTSFDLTHAGPATYAAGCHGWASVTIGQRPVVSLVLEPSASNIVEAVNAMREWCLAKR